MGNRSACTGKAEAVHRCICVADEAQSLVQLRLAALIDGFTEQQNGAAIARGLCPQLLDRGTLKTWIIAVHILNDVSQRMSAFAVQAATGLLAIFILLVVMNWFFHKR